MLNTIVQTAVKAMVSPPGRCSLSKITANTNWPGPGAQTSPEEFFVGPQPHADQGQEDRQHAYHRKLGVASGHFSKSDHLTAR
jgi:hypothetical protein